MDISCINCGHMLKVHDAAFNYGIPNITCPNCGKTFKPAIAAGMKGADVNAPGGDAKKNVQPLGWLVVHDEATKQQVFPLTLGKQLIGKKWPVVPEAANSKPDETRHIAIETPDLYMSRKHFYVTVIKNKRGDFDFILSDNKSRNATFINTNSLMKLSDGDEVYLHDSDLIQAGMTKLIFMSAKAMKTGKEATSFVNKKPYGKTVLIGS